jgi:hypothetical protein
VQLQQNLIGLADREKALALEYVVKVGLRDSGYASEAALGDFSAAHAVPQMPWADVFLVDIEGYWLLLRSHRKAPVCLMINGINFNNFKRL